MLRTTSPARAAAGHAAWIEVDLDALAHNVRAFRARIGSGCELIAVVKANAYGHGAVPCARAALVAGADRLAVGSVAEGEELRAAGIGAGIVVVGPCLPDQAAAAVAAGLTPTLATAEAVNAYAAAAQTARRRLDVHVEVDTGMHRHGVAAAAFPAFVDALRARSALHLTGAYTHFAGLTAGDLGALRGQLRAFAAALARVRDLGAPRRHACNSLGTALLPEAHLDAVRIGGGLYGFEPCPATMPLGLRPVLSLRARVAQVRDVAAGERVGYGGAFTCARPTRLLLLPLGYADGLQRHLWQGAPVLVRGRRAEIVGLVSMNQLVVDATAVPGVQAGDVVTLLGADGDQRIGAEERRQPGGSVYEVTALLRPGLPRLG